MKEERGKERETDERDRKQISKIINLNSIILMTAFQFRGKDSQPGLKSSIKPGAVAYDCYLSTLGG